MQLLRQSMIMSTSGRVGYPFSNVSPWSACLIIPPENLETRKKRCSSTLAKYLPSVATTHAATTATHDHEYPPCSGCPPLFFVMYLPPPCCKLVISPSFVFSYLSFFGFLRFLFSFLIFLAFFFSTAVLIAVPSRETFVFICISHS